MTGSLGKRVKEGTESGYLRSNLGTGKASILCKKKAIIYHKRMKSI